MESRNKQESKLLLNDESRKPQDDINHNMQHRVRFYATVGLTQLVGCLCVALVFIWTVKYMDGFAWDGSGKLFNYHPLFMVIGMVVLYGNSAISYRVLRNQEKLTVKLVHASLHLLTFVLAVVGLVAVFRFHNANGIPNLYSIHSWVGLTTVILFSLQIVFGFAAFLFPKFKENLRIDYLKIHVFFGCAIFGLVVVSCLSGITEKMLFGYADTYSDLPPVAYVANFLGVSIVVFAGLVGYILYNPLYQRINN